MSYDHSTFFLSCYVHNRNLHVLTHSFPTRRSSDLAAIDQGILTYCAANGVVDCGGGNFFGAAQYALLNPGKGITIAPAFALDGSFEDRKSTRLNSSH